HLLELLNSLVQFIQCTAVLRVGAIACLFQSSQCFVDGSHRCISIIWQWCRRRILLCWCFVLRGIISVSVVAIINYFDVLSRIRVNAYLLQCSINGWCIADTTLVGNKYAQQLREGRSLILTLRVNRLHVQDFAATYWQSQQVTVMQVVRTAPQRHISCNLVRRHHRVLRLLWTLGLGIRWQHANGNIAIAFWIRGCSHVSRQELTRETTEGRNQ